MNQKHPPIVGTADGEQAFPERLRHFFDCAVSPEVAALSGQRAGRLLRSALSGLLLPLLALFLLVGSTGPRSGPYGVYAKLPVALVTLNAEILPLGGDTCFPPLENADPGFPAASLATGSQAFASGPFVRLRARLDTASALQAGFSSASATPRKRGLVSFSRGRVSISTVDGAVPVALLRHSVLPPSSQDADIFQVDMFAPKRPESLELPPLLYGEAMDENGVPSRWNGKDGSLGSDLLVCGSDRLRNADIIRTLLQGLGLLSGQAQFTAQSGKYRTFISRYAEKYGLASSLMLAIMHTESGFNPFAVSRSRAVGLMQIVPDTAGNEVYRYLMGTQGTPSLESLFEPEYNIQYGAAYLHLLGRRYFGNVRNTASRQMCVIAAYNGGPNAVLRMFDDDPDAAVERINDLSPSEVYTALTTEMPNQETRRYVELVLGRIRNYSAY